MLIIANNILSKIPPVAPKLLACLLVIFFDFLHVYYYTRTITVNLSANATRVLLVGTYNYNMIIIISRHALQFGSVIIIPVRSPSPPRLPPNNRSRLPISNPAVVNLLKKHKNYNTHYTYIYMCALIRLLLHANTIL